jgi:hypothetical protein
MYRCRKKNKKQKAKRRFCFFAKLKKEKEQEDTTAELFLQILSRKITFLERVWGGKNFELCPSTLLSTTFSLAHVMVH